MTSIVDDYADIAKRTRGAATYRAYAHLFDEHGRCVYCYAYRGSPAVYYGTHCRRSPGAEHRNGHDFQQPGRRCVRCLAGQSSTKAEEECDR